MSRRPVTADRYMTRLARYMLVLAFIAVGLPLAFRQEAIERDDRRAEAQKYQRCVQTAATAVQANAAHRDAVELGSRSVVFFSALANLAGKSQTGTALDRRALIVSAGALERYTRIAQENAEREKSSPVPDCAALYRVGFEASIELGPIVPTTAAP